MKKLFFVLFTASMFILGCSSGSSKKDEANKFEEEIELYDSVTKELEQNKEDIEGSLEKLDEVLNEL